MIKFPSTQANLTFESIFNSSAHFWCLSPKETISYDLEQRFLVIINQIIKIKKLRVGGNFIQYSDNKFIDISNIQMEMCSHSEINASGIKLTRNKQTLEIYGDIQKLYEHLKPYAIQYYFQQKYQILQRIQKGTLENWFSIRHKITNQEFSSLILDKGSIPQVSFLLTNIQLLRSLKSQKLALLREIFESRNQVFLIFDQIDGISINELKLEKYLSESDISNIMKILFTILEYLHINNIFLNDKATFSNIYLRDVKDCNSIYIVDYFNIYEPYENNSLFYENAQKDVYRFGEIMKYLLDFNNEAIKLYSYELQEWSQLAFEFYQKINNPTLQFSSYDALHHKFIKQYSAITLHQGSKLFHMSEIGLQQLETSGQASTNQSLSKSPMKKLVEHKIRKINSNASSPGIKNEESFNDSIDTRIILQKYQQQINQSDLILNKNSEKIIHFINRSQQTLKPIEISKRIDTPSNISAHRLEQRLQQSTSIKERKYQVKKTTIFKQQSQLHQLLNIK